MHIYTCVLCCVVGCDSLSGQVEVSPLRGCYLGTGGNDVYARTIYIRCSHVQWVPIINVMQEDIDAESIATFNRRQMMLSPKELAVSCIVTLHTCDPVPPSCPSSLPVCSPSTTGVLQADEGVAGVQGRQFPAVLSERGSQLAPLQLVRQTELHPRGRDGPRKDSAVHRLSH